MTPKLKSERALRDLTQQDVADHLKITVQSYSAKENGKLEFTVREAKKILELFDKKFEEIF